MMPLTDMGSSTYTTPGGVTYDGGLYGSGLNERPADFEARVVAADASVVPLNAAGVRDDAAGKIGVVGVGLSNAKGRWAEARSEEAAHVRQRMVMRATFRRWGARLEARQNDRERQAIRGNLMAIAMAALQ